jgi:hypothetical protein
MWSTFFKKKQKGRPSGRRYLHPPERPPLVTVSRFSGYCGAVDGRRRRSPALNSNESNFLFRHLRHHGQAILNRQLLDLSVTHLAAEAEQGAPSRVYCRIPFHAESTVGSATGSNSSGLVFHR